MSAEKKTKLVMVGIGGYASVYLNKIFAEYDELPLELVAGVDPFPDGSPNYENFVRRNIPVYASVEEFYEHHTAELAVIVTPIHLHAQQIIYCMEHGSHVLTEKPVCALIDDVNRVIEARDRTGKQLAVGYQWSHSEAVQGLKRDVLAGKYGRALRMKSIVLWPRDFAYYARGCGWAAKKKTQDGHWILDSVASNATAHYLHNMLFVAGGAMNEAAAVQELEAETYRANAIEMFDTCAMRVRTVSGVEMLYLVTHAVAKSENRNPEFVFEFENGKAWTRVVDGQIDIVGQTTGGDLVDYGFPNGQDTRKLFWMLDVINGKRSVICGAETASMHTRCVNALAELIPETPRFPEEYMVHDDEHKMVYCRGLADELSRCYDRWLLPSEDGAPWAAAARKKNMTGYNHFSLLK